MVPHVASQGNTMTYSYFDFCGDRVDSRELRRALGRFPTGVTVITGHSPDTGRTEGMTANSFAAVSLSPALVLWSIRVDAPSFRTFNTAPAFAINVLAVEQGWLAKKFATPAANKFCGVDHHIGFGQCPVSTGLWQFSNARRTPAFPAAITSS